MYGREQMNGRTQSGGPISKIFKGLATGVGLASESIQHHKEKKAQGQQAEQQQQRRTAERAIARDDQTQDETTLEECDEANWQLDEAQQELYRETTQISSAAGKSEEIPALADHFIRDHPLPAHSEEPLPAGRLRLPIVVTQRRPKARDRGFIKAYAPILEDVGIDQATFLDFINKLNKAVEPSPWIQAINLASFATQHVPLAVSIAVSAALKIVADSASAVHSRTKTNSFLDKINEEYFKPRGLVALLMTWKPQDPSTITTASFDLETTIAKASSGSNQGTFAKIQSRMKSSSAASSFEFPEVAPLIYPALDKIAFSAPEDLNGETKKENIVKRGGGFVGDYLDRRAVAQWAGENPEGKLANAAPKPEFRSRYADPNHPASSGDPLAFITGGKISSGILTQNAGAGAGATNRGFDVGSNMDGSRSATAGRGFGRSGLRDRRSMLQPRRPGHSDPQTSYGGRSRDSESPRGQPVSSSRGELFGSGIGPLSLIGGVQKLLQKDVLYLMIVNLPTEDEMAQAATMFR